MGDRTNIYRTGNALQASTVFLKMIPYDKKPNYMVNILLFKHFRDIFRPCVMHSLTLRIVLTQKKSSRNDQESEDKTISVFSFGST